MAQARPCAALVSPFRRHHTSMPLRPRRVDRDDARTHGAEGVEAFRPCPLLVAALQVAGSHVVHAGDSRDRRFRLRYRGTTQRSLKDDADLSFIFHLDRFGRQDDRPLPPSPITADWGASREKGAAPAGRDPQAPLRGRRSCVRHTRSSRVARCSRRGPESCGDAVRRLCTVLTPPRGRGAASSHQSCPQGPSRMLGSFRRSGQTVSGQRDLSVAKS